MLSDEIQTPYEGGNRVIDGLPPTDRDAVIRDLTVIAVADSRDGLVRGESITAAYFPIDAVFSILVEMEAGNCYEVDSVGRDSAIGAELMFGIGTVSRAALCQIGGQVALMPLERFEHHLATAPSFTAAVQHAFFLQWYSAQQTIACNFAHAAVERCARWIMLTRDAVGRDEFTFRAEYLSMMLGLQPDDVIMPMDTLQSAGAILYADDVVTVLSEPELLDFVCECYPASSAFGHDLQERRDGAA